MADNQFEGKLEEFSYALGLSISSNLLQSGVKDIDATLIFEVELLEIV